MASYQKIIIVGHLGKEVESRYLPSGDAVANFSVAVSESWKDKNSGEKRENTTWFRVNAFGKLAEICSQYLVKGSSVLIEGKMQARDWEDKDGNKRQSWELKADSMQMLGSKPSGGSGDQPAPEPRRAPASNPAQGQAKKPSPNFDDLDDDIPF
jgi:single-strand DNA-binding protein